LAIQSVMLMLPYGPWLYSTCRVKVKINWYWTPLRTRLREMAS
jgi:hypothetical protein